MKIRAKFRCDRAEMTDYGEQVEMSAVYAEDGPNKEWSQWTPAGALSMTITNPGAQGKFQVDKEYFLDLVPAEEI